MNKFGGRMMRHTYFSKKNHASMTVLSKGALQCACILEQDDEIISYEASIVIEQIEQNISMTGIRHEYRHQKWISDFLATKKDGTQIAIETAVDIYSHAELQRLELSRRYWQSKGVSFMIYLEEKS